MFRRRGKPDSTKDQASVVAEASPRPGTVLGFVRVMRGYFPNEVDPYLVKLDAEIAALRDQVDAADGQPAPAPATSPGALVEDDVPSFSAVMRGYDPHQVDKHIAKQAAKIRDLRAQLQDLSSKF